MKLQKKLSSKQSALFLTLIFIVGLAYVFWLHYIFNIQYQEGKPFLNGPVTTAPKTLRLDLDQPDDDSLSFESSILVSGKTSPGKDILIFTDSQNLVVKSKNDGSFSTVLELDKGVNKITAVVFEINGDLKEVVRTVYFSEEKL